MQLDWVADARAGAVALDIVQLLGTDAALGDCRSEDLNLRSMRWLREGRLAIPVVVHGDASNRRIALARAAARGEDHQRGAVRHHGASGIVRKGTAHAVCSPDHPIHLPDWRVG